MYVPVWMVSFVNFESNKQMLGSYYGYDVPLILAPWPNFSLHRDYLVFLQIIMFNVYNVGT